MTKPLAIGFILPASGGGGGANSIVQEASGLDRWGCDVAIFIDKDNIAAFTRNYPELLATKVKLTPFEDAASLGNVLGTVDVACATTALSVRLFAEALAAVPRTAVRPRAAYYVQDYEPLFFDPDSAHWKEAFDSYALIPQAQLFAKTDWICDMVEQNHGIRVARVQASIDHDIYYPDLARDRSGAVTITAMLRPKTRRRAPFRTVRILNWLAQEYGEGVKIEVFGTTDAALQNDGIPLPHTVINHGPLRRTQVPHVLRRADLFLDLSDYQAFGRTGIEAMASGCVPVVPLLGGSAEYAVDGWNSFVVDTRSDEAIKAPLAAFLAMSPAARRAMMLNGIETGARFSIDRAVASELAVFEKLREA
jgi:glycosyltransferase involved in cell wall biosynthesis